MGCKNVKILSVKTMEINPSYSNNNLSNQMINYSVMLRVKLSVKAQHLID